MTLRERLTPMFKHLPQRLQQPTRWWLIPPLGAGVLLVAMAAAFAPGASRDDGEGAAPPVRVLALAAQSVRPRLSGYGEVVARRTWQGVPQVGGKIAWRHPQLRAGATFEAGTRLLTIEPVDYALAESRAAAGLSAAEAGLAEVRSRTQDLKASLAIETRSLEIAQKRYERNVTLARDGHISALQLDEQERDLLRQQQSVNTLETQVHLLPSQMRSAEARVAEAAAGLEKAAADLARTELSIPFTGRILRFSAEQNQFVPAGQAVVEAASTRDVEVRMEVPYGEMLARFPGVMGNAGSLADPGALLTAQVRYDTDAGPVVWQGRVSRIDSGLSANSRSALVYVVLDVADGQIAPAANMYVAVTLLGLELDDRIVIPRSAWRAGTVLLVDDDNRLRRRPVAAAYADDDQVLVRTGLQDGDRLILTDVLFPNDGMKVSPVVVEQGDGS